MCNSRHRLIKIGSSDNKHRRLLDHKTRLAVKAQIMKTAEIQLNCSYWLIPGCTWLADFCSTASIRTIYFITTNITHECVTDLSSHLGTWDRYFSPFSLWAHPAGYLQAEKHIVLTWACANLYSYHKHETDALCTGCTQVINWMLMILPKQQQFPVKAQSKDKDTRKGWKKSSKNDGFQSKKDVITKQSSSFLV